jgi:hypothetical protein
MIYTFTTFTQETVPCTTAIYKRINAIERQITIDNRINQTILIHHNMKGKVVPVLNKAPRNEGASLAQIRT